VTGSKPTHSLDFYFQAALMVVGFFAMLTLPVQGIIEIYQWLRTGEWPNYAGSGFLPEDILLWIYGDADDWIGLRELVGTVAQWWVSVPVAIGGFLLLLLATQIEG
jgi:hypothetical protein